MSGLTDPIQQIGDGWCLGLVYLCRCPSVFQILALKYMSIHRTYFMAGRISFQVIHYTSHGELPWSTICIHQSLCDTNYVLWNGMINNHEVSYSVDDYTCGPFHQPFFCRNSCLVKIDFAVFYFLVIRLQEIITHAWTAWLPSHMQNVAITLSEFC